MHCLALAAPHLMGWTPNDEQAQQQCCGYLLLTLLLLLVLACLQQALAQL
jgi:hypothetical protein